MANVFFNLPLPVLNGPGAAVATSTSGRTKTIVVAGDFPGATITIEASVDGGVVFAPVTTFQSGDQQRVVNLAAEFMRVSVSGRKASVPFAANIDVGSNDSGALFGIIALPALNGPGAPLNISTFGLFTTFIAGGSFVGAAILVEASEDGIDWAPCAQFSGQGGLQSKLLTANFVRANVSGRKASVPFTGSLAVGAINDATGGGGSSGDPQAFRYTVIAGPDLSDFMVPLPAARATDVYRVQATLAGVTVIVGFDCPDLLAADRTTLAFRFIADTPMTVGDQIEFYVSDPIP